MSPDRQYSILRGTINRKLDGIIRRVEPVEMRRALVYVLGAGGKRIRSVVALLSCEAVGGNAARALSAAAAIELLHAFTLVHDDIMDHAPTRRGRPTLHTKSGLSYGILGGDVLLATAYRALGEAPVKQRRELVQLLTVGLLQVCEGQALDLRLEAARSVPLIAYFRMIERKTAALFSVPAQMGGIVGGGTPGQIGALRRFGHHLGRAFQIRDDLLDVVAEERTFGKIVGGDILEGKRTFLLLRALGKAGGKDRAVLRAVMQGRRSGGKKATIRRVTEVYRKLGIPEDAKARIDRESELARHALRALPRNGGTDMLSWVAERLRGRLS